MTEKITPKTSIEVEKLNLYYGSKQALMDVNMRVQQNHITAFIGPSGCGKSTLLKCFNRLNDLVDFCRVEGAIRIGGEDIYQKSMDVTELRRRVGMVFQKPNPFPKSIFENVVYGLRLQGIRSQLQERAEEALMSAALWDEVKDRLHESAMSLSGGQQQRLVLARAIAVRPDILLLDEPASALDPISTLKIEQLCMTLKEHYTILIVTHNMQQAARISDQTAFMYLGKLVEFADTQTLFTKPENTLTEDYITGRYG